MTTKIKIKSSRSIQWLQVALLSIPVIEEGAQLKIKISSQWLIYRQVIVDQTPAASSSLCVSLDHINLQLSFSMINNKDSSHYMLLCSFFFVFLFVLLPRLLLLFLSTINISININSSNSNYSIRATTSSILLDLKVEENEQEEMRSGQCCVMVTVLVAQTIMSVVTTPKVNSKILKQQSTLNTTT